MENFNLTYSNKLGIKVYSQNISTLEKSLLLKKDKGKYKVIEFSRKNLFEEKYYDSIIETMSRQIKSLLKYYEFSKERDAVLIVGVGNPDIVSDSLGPRVIKKLSKRLCTDILLPKTMLFIPDIKEKTGIDTAEFVKSITFSKKIGVVVFVDTLSTDYENRISSSIQIFTSGLKPGAGVGAKKEKMSNDNLFSCCITIGVPLMKVGSIENNTYITTLSNIDLIVDRNAAIIATALAKCLYGKGYSII